MLKKLTALICVFSVLICHIPVSANEEKMKTITFDSWNNAYAEANFRVIYNNSSNPSVFGSAFANRKVFGKASKSFFYGNSQGSASEYGGGYGKIYNFTDSAFDSSYKYKLLSFDIAVLSAKTNMYIYSSKSPGTILFKITNGKIYIQKKQVLENVREKRWYNIKLIEKSDGTWKTYIDGELLCEQQASLVKAFNELRFVLCSNTDTYSSESGELLYNANGFYLDNIELQTLGNAPVTEAQMINLTSTAAEIKNDFPRQISVSRSVSAKELLSSLNITEAAVVDADSNPVPETSSTAGRYLRVLSGGSEIIYPIKSNGGTSRDFETKVFANENFNTSAGNITAVKKNGEIGLVNQNGEGYLSVKKEASSDMYFEINNFAAIDKKLICEFTMINKNPGIEGSMFMLRDSTTGTNITESYLRLSGERLYAGGNVLCTLPQGTKRDIALVFDLNNHTWDAYADGKAVCSGAATAESLECITCARFYFASGSGEIYFDNLKLYNAEEICNIDGLLPVSASPFKNEAYGKIPLKGSIAVEADVSSVWDGNEKYYTENPIVFKDGEYFMESGEAKALFGVSADEVRIIDSTEYASIDKMAQKAGLQSNEVKKGFFVFSEGDYKYSGSAADEAYKYMAFRRYSPQELVQKSKETHPYILGASDDRFAELSGLADENKFVAERYGKIKASADNYLNASVLAYKKTGIRLYSVAVEFKKRASELALMYKLTGEEKYKTRLENEIKAVCAFPDWNAQEHFLDASEIAFGMALCIDWLYGDLSAETLSLAKEKLNEYFLDYAELGYNGKMSAFWITSDINWNAVCNGAAAIAAMAVFEDNPERYSVVIANALRGYEECITQFSPSGSWHEGPHYCEYTTEYLSYLHSSLEGFFGSDLDFGKIRGIDKIGYYQIGIDSPQGMNDYHDGFSEHINSAALLYFGKRFNDSRITSAKLYYDRLLGTFPEASELIWLDTSVTEAEIDIAPDMYFEKDEVAVLCGSRQGENAVFASFHGGDNSDAHAHTDAGAFVLNMSGEKWFIDIPIENYDATGESAQFRKSLKGHNTVEIIQNGQESGTQNKDKRAYITAFEQGTQSSFAIMNLTDVYDEVNGFYRGIKLSNEKKSFHIRDEITVKAPSEIIWRAATDVDAVTDGSSFVLSKNGKSITVYVNTENAVLSVNNSLPLSSYRNPGKKIKQIEIRVSAIGEAVIDVCVSQNGQASALPLDMWSVSEAAACFKNTNGDEVYKMPKGAVIAENTSSEMQLVACYKDGKLVQCIKNPPGQSCTASESDCIKVFEWGNNLRPKTNYKVIKQEH